MTHPLCRVVYRKGGVLSWMKTGTSTRKAMTGVCPVQDIDKLYRTDNLPGMACRLSNLILEEERPP